MHQVQICPLTLSVRRFHNLMAISRTSTATIKNKLAKQNNFNSQVIAYGGYEYIKDGFKYHKFLGEGNLEVFAPGNCEVLLIGGGGAGITGGGGAGGVLYTSSLDLTPSTYTVGIGRGASSGTITNDFANITTSFTGLTSPVNGGISSSTAAGQNGGSGGGGGGATTTGVNPAGGTGTAGQGNNGGAGFGNSTVALRAGGGGGGASSAGTNASSGQGGNGGSGTNAYSDWGIATNSGVDVSGTRYFAAGGFGNSGTTPGTTGLGNDASNPVTQNSGNGSNGQSGGVGRYRTGSNGIAIIRYRYS